MIPPDNIITVLLALVIILPLARLGAGGAARVGQPAVLGELVLGVVLGNLALIGVNWFEPIKQSHVIEILAELGVILLLFQVGLESNLGEMLKLGTSSFLVATLGVVVPFLLGWAIGAWFYPTASVYMHVFLGATLTATSVGITARVLKDLKRTDTNEARIILGAAVIDDIMGLVILAIVSGVIVAASGGHSLSSLAVMWLVAKAILFLVGAIILSRWTYPYLFRMASYLHVRGMLLITALVTCFLLAFLAAKAGLAPIVGAFAAGLILDKLYYRDLPKLAEHSLEELLDPIALFLVPIFFVRMGLSVDLATFGQLSVLGFALVLTLVAVLGKQFAAFGVITPGANRWIVGLGMIPRGEVGLIFASVGVGLSVAGQRLVSAEVYSAVVVMVIITTLMTPPLLAWAFRRRDAAHRNPETPS